MRFELCLDKAKNRVDSIPCSGVSDELRGVCEYVDEMIPGHCEAKVNIGVRVNGGDVDPPLDEEALPALEGILSIRQRCVSIGALQRLYSGDQPHTGGLPVC